MSKKSKRSLLSVFIMALVCVFTFTFVGCKDKTDPADQAAVVWTIEKAYAQAQSEGFTGTYEEFLQKLIGSCAAFAKVIIIATYNGLAGALFYQNVLYKFFGGKVFNSLKIGYKRKIHSFIRKIF